MNVRTLVLVGPHGSGKTTLGRELSKVLGWPFDEEIGKRLRSEALASDPSAHAMAPQPEFDHRVMVEETARDAHRAQEGNCRIVESWHPGNQAFAESRSPEVAALWRSPLQRLSRATPDLLVVPLAIRPETVRDRLSEPGPRDIAARLWTIARRAVDIAREWRLPVADPVITEGRSVEASLAEVLHRMESQSNAHGIGRRGSGVKT